MRQVWFGKAGARFASRRAVRRHSRLTCQVGRVSPRRATYFLVVRQESRQRNVPRCRAPFGGSLLPAMPGGVFANSPFGLRHAKPFFRPSSPPVGAPEGKENADDQRPVPDSMSAGARCVRKARSDPPSSAAAGGAFRCGCLSRRSRRVPHRPPAGSSAGQSFAQRMTGVAGSPFLPSSLAKQRRRSPAGGGGGVSRSMLRAAVAGRVCKPGRGKTRPMSRQPTERRPVAASPSGLESLALWGNNAFHT